jgi:hypothetical protein
VRLGLALFIGLIVNVHLHAQSQPCASCPALASRSVLHPHAVCLSDSEMVTHVDAQKPISPPGMNEPHVNIRGMIEACLCFSPKGKVTDVTILSGPAMMRQSVLESMSGWTFHPIIRGRRPLRGCGVLRVQINVVNSAVTSKLESGIR